MKKLLLLLLFIPLVFGCSEEDPCDPQPKMGATILIEAGYNSILVSGTITPPTCDISIISQGFVLDDEQLPTINKTKKIISGKSIQGTFDGLQPNTTYYIRTFLTNIDGDYYGSQLEIKTQNPTVTFSEVGVEKSFESALFSSKYAFSEGSGLNVKTKGFEIDGQTYPDSDSANGLINVSVNNLNVNKSYAYKAFAQTEYGYYYSDESTFNTDDPTSTLSSLSVENIGYDNADFSATYENSYSGADITTEKGFILSINEDFSNATKHKSETNSKTFKLSKNDLSSGKKYYVKAYVENSYGTYTSESKSFETISAGYVFKTNYASEIDYDSVKLVSEFSQNQGDNLEINEVGFLFSLNDDMSGSSTKPSSNNDGNISFDIENLTTNTKYYFQAYVVNKYGTWTSQISNFVTKNAIPQFSFDLIDNTVWFDKVKANFSLTIPNDVSIKSFYIDIENVNSSQTTRIDYLESNPNYIGGSFEYEIINLEPNTNYKVKMILVNPYGTFSSDNYLFNTKDDTPFMKSFTTNPESNKVQFSYNINPVDGDLVNKIYLKYKNNEDSEYTTINLETTTNTSNNWNTDNQSIYIDNIVQGPEYEYILHYENEWNTHTYSHYDTKAVEYKVGDIKFGGMIVYIDQTGYHGLIAAEADKYIKKLSWSSDKDASDDLDIPPYNYNEDGQANTKKILEYYSKIDATAPAAEYCDNFSVSGYDDWYLPSMKELKKVKITFWNLSVSGYSGSFLGPIDTTWTSNTPFESAGYTKDYAIATYHNGCNGSNDCQNNNKKSTEIPTIPVRKF
jgi:hypothetical protein